MSFPRIQELEVIPSTELENVGWQGLHERLKGSPAGVLAIGSHQRLEGVLLTPDEYTRLIRLAGLRFPEENEILEDIRREFDQQLAPLSEPERLNDAITGPLFVDGRFLKGRLD